MKTSNRTWSLSALLLTVLLVSLPLAGCDTIDPGPEPVVVEIEQSFRFETTREQLEQGGIITTGDRLDVSQRLSQLGFSPSDILNAEVIEARLERIQPVGASLNTFLASASVRTVVGSLPEVTLASSSTMSAAAMQPLSVSSVNNLAAYLRAGNAQVRLSVAGGPSITNQNYVMGVTLTLRVTLEGV
jgi:hypothetical protein